MGKVVQFPQHYRPSAGTRAASEANKSAVTPAVFAFSVAKSADHHSDGMLSRFSHLRTAQAPAPTSAANASRESQRSIIERNESNLDMSESMGQTVPKIKAILSHDIILSTGHSVRMADDVENIAESAWREAFCRRLKQIQGERTQEDMADILCISRDSWNKYVNRGSAVPIRLLPKIAKIGAKPLEWLIEGPRPEKGQKSKPAAKSGKVAARR